MKTMLILISSMFLFVCISCKQDSAESQLDIPEVSFMQIPPQDEEMQASQDIGPVPSLERKIIKNGTVRFDTKDAGKTQNFLAESVKEYQGLVVEESIKDQEYQMEYHMTVQIPADKFDVFLEAISERADNLRSKNINAQDVTEEYIDVESRLKTKKELESRYLQLLQRATKVEEMLAIEKEIGALRSDIESIEGRLRYLKDRVAYSLLTVIFYEKTPSSFGFASKLGVALNEGWVSLLEFLFALIGLWPVWVSGIALLLAGRQFVKRRKSLSEV